MNPANIHHFRHQRLIFPDHFASSAVAGLEQWPGMMLGNEQRSCGSEITKHRWWGLSSQGAGELGWGELGPSWDNLL